MSLGVYRSVQQHLRHANRPHPFPRLRVQVPGSPDRKVHLPPGVPESPFELGWGSRRRSLNMSGCLNSKMEPPPNGPSQTIHLQSRGSGRTYRDVVPPQTGSQPRGRTKTRKVCPVRRRCFLRSEPSALPSLHKRESGPPVFRV